MKNILKYGLIAGAAYLAYRSGVLSMFGIGTAAAAPATGAPGGTSTGATSAAQPAAPNNTVYTPPSTLQQLQKLAAPASTLNADQWSYYYNRIAGKSISDATKNAIFWPNGYPTGADGQPDVGQFPTFTAADYLTAIATKGLSGLGDVMSHMDTVTLARRAASGDVIAAAHADMRGVKLMPAQWARVRQAITGVAEPIPMTPRSPIAATHFLAAFARATKRPNGGGGSISLAGIRL